MERVVYYMLKVQITTHIDFQDLHGNEAKKDIQKQFFVFQLDARHGKKVWKIGCTTLVS